MKYFLTVLVLSLKLFALTPDDIKAMNDFGILVSFSDMEKPKKISKDLSARSFLDATYLSFNNANIYNLPDWISKLTKLKGLDLSNAKIDLDELEKITPLTKLTVLKLANNEKLLKDTNNSNKILSILSNFDLNELDLSNTGGKLCSYKNFNRIKNLVELFLSHNDLSENNNCTFQDIGLDKLNELKVLDLSHNSINGDLNSKFLPKLKLEKLNLSFNNIKNFKYDKPFPKLEMLDLSKNSNLVIEDAFGGLLALKKLVHLKRESNIKLPKGLKKRLELAKKSVTEEKEKKYKGILKKLGLEKTHGYLKEEFYGSNIADIIHEGDILYLKQDLQFTKNTTKIGNYILAYNQGYKKINFLTDNITIPEGTQLTVLKERVGSNSYYKNSVEITFKGTSPIKNIEAKNDDKYQIKYINQFIQDTKDYFEIFIKR